MALLDTGINSDHQVFCEDQIERWMDFVNGRPNPYDDNGHGTTVASRVAGQALSVNTTALGSYPCADLHVYKVLDSEAVGTVEAISRAIPLAAESGCGSQVDTEIDYLGEDIKKPAHNLEAGEVRSHP